MIQNSRLASRYAYALLDAAKANNSTEKVMQDIKFIFQVLDESRELRLLLHSPVIQHWRKKGVLKEIFEGKISELTLRFLELLTEKGREAALSDVLEMFELIYNQENNIEEAEIYTAVEVDEALKEKLLRGIEQKLGKKLVPVFHVDPTIKGGVVFKVGDMVFDGSLRHQLEMLYHQLMQGSLKPSGSNPKLNGVAA